MLRTFGQLLHDISQHDPTMLQDAALKCCVEMLRAFGRAFKLFKLYDVPFGRDRRSDFKVKEF